MNGLSQRSALADHDNVSFLDCESRRAVDWDISVPFLISVVFWDVVKVITSNDDGPLHFGGNTDALKDLSPDGDAAGEGTFLINVLGFDGFLGSFEAKTDILEVSDSSGGLLGQQFLAIKEDIFLLLESPFVLRLWD